MQTLILRLGDLCLCSRCLRRVRVHGEIRTVYAYHPRAYGCIRSENEAFKVEHFDLLT